jgi:hypothetical protein
LILQVWPSFVLIFFVMLRSVADPGSPRLAVKVATRKSEAISARREPAGKQRR